MCETNINNMECDLYISLLTDDNKFYPFVSSKFVEVLDNFKHFLRIEQND